MFHLLPWFGVYDCIAGIQVSGGDKTKIHGKNGTNEKDVFFDAAEEVEIVSDNSSLKRSGTYTVEEREPGYPISRFWGR